MVHTAVQFLRLPQCATVQEQQAARAEAVLRATVPAQPTLPDVTELQTLEVEAEQA